MKPLDDSTLLGTDAAPMDLAPGRLAGVAAKAMVLGVVLVGAAAAALRHLADAPDPASWDCDVCALLLLLGLLGAALVFLGASLGAFAMLRRARGVRSGEDSNLRDSAGCLRE